MKPKVIFWNILLIIFINAAHGIESMSQEEKDIREKMDQVKENLFRCYAFNKVNPMDKNPSVCVNERKAFIKQGEIFNTFMRSLDHSRRNPPEEFSKKRNEFIAKYKTYRLEDLQALHRKNCRTKWGSTASTECQVIASQSSIKERKKFKEFETKFKSYTLENLEPLHKANCPLQWFKSSIECKAMASKIKNIFRGKYKHRSLEDLMALHQTNCPEKPTDSSLKCQVINWEIRQKRGASSK